MDRNIKLASSIEDNQEVYNMKTFVIVDNLYNKSYKVPNPPKKSCPKCYGRGFIGYNFNKTIILCPKCYDRLSFKQTTEK